MSLYRTPATLAREDDARAEIAKHEGVISVLQSQINSLVQQISAVEVEKRRHEKEIKRQLAILSLAGRVPGEVLTHIFELAIFDGWTLGPLIVSQVCMSWREAAKAPSVWSQLYIDCDKGDPSARCKLWLSRARDAPLNVTFRTSMQLSSTNSALVAVSGRVENWRSFHLDAQTLELANLVLSQIPRAGPRLSEINISVGESSVPLTIEEEGTQQVTGQLNAHSVPLLDCPSLKKVTIVADQSRVWIGLPQITSLNLQLSGSVFNNQRPIFASEIMDVLDASPKLRDLSISIPLDGSRALADFVGEPLRIVKLDSLKSLTLQMPIPFMSIMKHFQAEVLQSLTLRCPDAMHFPEDVMRASLRSFLDRSNAPLRLLHLYDVDISQDDFLHFFSTIPTIEDIFLHGSDILDETILSLKAPTSILPSLRRLELRWCGHITGEAIEQVVRSRNSREQSEGSVWPIEEVTLIACSGVKEKEILSIAEVCRCRLKMRDDNDYCREFYLFTN